MCGHTAHCQCVSSCVSGEEEEEEEEKDTLTTQDV